MTCKICIVYLTDLGMQSFLLTTKPKRPWMPLEGQIWMAGRFAWTLPPLVLREVEELPGVGVVVPLEVEEEEVIHVSL